MPRNSNFDRIIEEAAMFTPDIRAVRQYKEQVAALLANKSPKSDTIDMGNLPKIYGALGITDKRLKTNGKTILKALGMEGKNKHSVPAEVVENLLPLAYDPEAVFKSLSTSDNPDAYIAVLNAKAKNQDQIIAILSPSRDGQGFTFIPSVYEKHNFKGFLAKIHNEQKVLYIKNEGSELWGQLQSLPRHNFEPSANNIPTKKDIVKRILNQTKEYAMLDSMSTKHDKHERLPTDAELALESAHGFVDYFLKNEGYETPTQVPTPPLPRGDINSKENIMSDEMESGNARNPKEEAFLSAVHHRKVIADALKAGTLSCLPGPDGYADTAPAVNLVTGKHYHGENMLFIKEHQKQNKFPSAEYVTGRQIDLAKQDNQDLYIRKGEKGISLYVSEKSEETGEWTEKNIRLFNVAQLNKPWDMREWAEEKQQERAQKRAEYLRSQYGDNYKPEEREPKEPGPDVVCSSTDPERYLGQYLAAVSMGSKFKASPEQSKEFAEKMEGTLFAPVEKYNGHTDPFKLEEISRNAGQHCIEVIREAKMEARKQEQPEQKLEQQQAQGRRM